MIHIAIVEDDDEAASTLDGHAHRYSSEYAVPLQTRRYSNGEDFLDERAQVFDIVLLDIEMPGSNGMIVAERLRAVNDDIVIIFTTNIAGYAIAGYRVKALEYLLKPIGYAAFTMCFERAIRALPSKESPRLSITTRAVTHRIPAAELLWAESRGHTIHYRTIHGELQSTTTPLSELETQLGAHAFFRISKGVLVNLEKIRTVTRDSVVIDGAEFAISRSRRRLFLEAIADFAAGSAR